MVQEGSRARRGSFRTQALENMADGAQNRKGFNKPLYENSQTFVDLVAEVHRTYKNSANISKIFKLLNATKKENQGDYITVNTNSTKPASDSEGEDFGFG